MQIALARPFQQFLGDLAKPASLFYPIILRVSGIKNGRPFRGNYRLVFDKNSLTYLAPKNLPDEIKPERWQERSPD